MTEFASIRGRRSGTPGPRRAVLPTVMVLCGALALALAPAGRAGAEVWHASEWLQIQEMVDAAAYGDTVMVAPGLYDRIILRSGVHLMAESGPHDTTLRNSRFWVIKADGVDSTAVVEGFTLDGVKAAEGVVYAENSFFTLTDCVLKNGWSGVRALYSDLTVQNCTITDCQNGIYLYESNGRLLNNDIQLCITGINLVSSSPRVARNTLTRNSYGMQVSDHSDPAIGGSLASANRIWNNAAVAIKNSAYQKKFSVRTMKPMTLEVPYNVWGTDCPDSLLFQGPVVFAPWVDSTGSRSLQECEPGASGETADEAAAGSPAGEEE